MHSNNKKLAIALGALWLLLGIYWHFGPVTAAVDANSIMDNPHPYAGKTCLVSGRLQFGLEKNYIGEIKRGFTISSFPISLKFKNSLAKFLEGWPVSGQAVLRGTVSGVGKYGHFGMSNLQMSNVEVIRWPLIIAVPLFMLIHVLPLIFVLVLRI